MSLDTTRKIVDKCVAAYLLQQLTHNVGSTSSYATPLPQSPGWSPSSVPDGVEYDTIDGSHALTNSPTKYNSGHPIDQMDAFLSPTEDSRRVDEFDPGTYSKSSPGNFSDSHMKHENQELQSGSENARVANTQYSPEDERNDHTHADRADASKQIFKPLEEYIMTCFASFECINTSFSTVRTTDAQRAQRAQNKDAKRSMTAPLTDRPSRKDLPISDNTSGPWAHTANRNDAELYEMDPKMLLLGDFAENGSWWTGSRSNKRSPERSRAFRSPDSPHDNTDIVTLKSPRLDWSDLNEWYHVVLSAGKSWRRKLDELLASDSNSTPASSVLDLAEIEDKIMTAQSHLQRVLLKAIESLLKRPGRPLKEPSDLRFILILLANPLLYPAPSVSTHRERSLSSPQDRSSPTKPERLVQRKPVPGRNPRKPDSGKGSAGQHSGIIKRIVGLLSNVPNECHHHIVSWFARYPDGQFQRITDLVGSFVTYRLTRQHGKRREVEQDLTGGLIPNIRGSGRNTPAALHAALGPPNQTPKKNDGKPKPVIYNDDWQIKAAARVMALIFSANNSGLVKRGESGLFTAASNNGHSAGLAARSKAHRHGHILPISDFYNTLLDYSDLIADFEAWESKRSKFAFCQYPFFLSIWAKIQIMEHDARRQMEVKAREAFFDSIMTRKNVNQYLTLKIRRECLVEDSLKGVGAVVGTVGEEIKKGLRIEFRGEEGIDAGGLRKEWFLLLVRDVFNPEHGKIRSRFFNTRLTALRNVYVR